jgi:hypothetical protein
LLVGAGEPCLCRHPVSSATSGPTGRERLNLSPSRALAAAAESAGKPYQVKFYPAFEASKEEGHAFGCLGPWISSPKIQPEILSQARCDVSHGRPLELRCRVVVGLPHLPATTAFHPTRNQPILNRRDIRLINPPGLPCPSTGIHVMREPTQVAEDWIGPRYFAYFSGAGVQIAGHSDAVRKCARMLGQPRRSELGCTRCRRARDRLRNLLMNQSTVESGLR